MKMIQTRTQTSKCILVSRAGRRMSGCSRNFLQQNVLDDAKEDLLSDSPGIALDNSNNSGRSVFWVSRSLLVPRGAVLREMRLVVLII